MNIDEVRAEVSGMMGALQQQLDYLDYVFEAEQERRRIEKEQNCFCKFMNRLLNRNLRNL